MKKIMLIDDQKSRLERFKSELANDEFENLVYFANDAEIEDLKLHKTYMLDEFDVIMIHDSIKDSSYREIGRELKDKLSDKKIVIFSGGIPYCQYGDNIADPSWIMLTERSFYSRNLVKFVCENKDNLLFLEHGDDYMVTILRQIITKIEILNLEPIDYFDDFCEISGVDKITNLVDLSDLYENDEINEEVANEVKKRVKRALQRINDE